ncbi:MAG: ATP synthase F0 subunit C [Desulfobacteraceae bacterium]|nr:ATP synthase F0 subunit C [Desulfobacteraceae bacterium]MBC2753525.1 ATP synthase F0 subunit C [Desulfobacteraceae bacterium]
MDNLALTHTAAFIGGALAMGLGAIGAATGEGYTASRASEAIARSQENAGDIIKNMLVGQAISESASIFSLVVAILLLFMDITDPGIAKAASLLAAGLCMGFGAIGSGVGAGIPAGRSCLAIARQPAISGRITTNMLIGTAVCQTPAIFAMVVALILLFKPTGDLAAFPTCAALIGAGLSTGLAAIGSGYGGGMAAGASCEGVSRQPETATAVTTTMLVGQAVAQTPSVFGLLISFVLMFRSFPESTALSASVGLLSAGLCMGLGGIGPGIGNGMTAEGAVRWVARRADYAGDLMRIMLVGQAVSQSTAIYAMVVSLVLIFVV